MKLNPAYDPAAVPAQSTEALAFHRALPGYAPTPVHDLGGGVFLKDESRRLGLPAFKILGVSWAVERALREDPTVKALTAASAGNHGRAVAHVAAQRGLYCRIFLPARASAARREAIAAEGADVVMIDGTYEDAVARAQRYAYEGPYVVELADVGSSSSARWVIDGYATLFAELTEDYDTVIVPVGVGSLGAAAARWGAQTATKVIAAEPDTAACLAAALDAGREVTVATPGTSMAGLDCAAVSAAAWDSLRTGIWGTVAVTDAQAHAAMRELAARGLAIGDSGAAPLAALHVVATDAGAAAAPDDRGTAPAHAAAPADRGTAPRAALAAGALGRVLLIATEGVTDPDGYRATVAS